jgi:MBG domain (YGX type)
VTRIGSPRRPSPRLRCERLEDRTVPTFTSLGAAIDIHARTYGSFNGVTQFDEDQGQTGSISPDINLSYTPSHFYRLDPVNFEHAEATASIQSSLTPSADLQSGRVSITATAGWGWQVTFPNFANASARASVSWSYDFSSDTAFLFTAQALGRVPAISLLNIGNPNAIAPAAPVNGALPSGIYRLVISKSNELLAGQGEADWSVRSVQTTPVVTVTDAGGTYNGSPYPATATVNGGASLEGVGLTLDYVRHNPDGSTTDLGPAAPGNAGNYTVTASFPGSPSYTSAQAATNFTIAQATPAVSVTPYAVTYDGRPHPVTEATYTVTGVNGEAGAAVGTVTLSGEPHTDAGTYEDAWSFTGTANYASIPSTPLIDVIYKAPSTTTVTIPGGPFTYTGLPQTPATVRVTGAGGLNLTPAAVYADNLNAGTATASYAYGGDNNHEASSDSRTFTIGRATPAVAVSGYKGGTYDGSAHTQIVTVTGVPHDGLLYADRLTGTDAAIYGLLWFYSDPNYNRVSGNLAFTIARAALTITANDDTKVYGTLKTFGSTAFTQTGLVAGDAITGVTETSTGAAVAAAVGTYPIGPSAATGTGLGNYDITYVNGTLTVVPPVTVPAGVQTADEDVDKTIGGIRINAGLGGNLTLTLGVGHGTLTLGTTAGLTVTGNGTGSVSLTGSAADLNAALAALVYRGSLNFSGADALTLTLGNGDFSWTASVAITVISAAQQATDLQTQVNTLVAAGQLSAAQAEALNLNLRDNNGDAGKVQAFLNQVAAFISGGILTQAEAGSLLDGGNILLLSAARR